MINRIIIILFLGVAIFCRAENNAIDSCEIIYTSSIVFPSCKIIVKKNHGHIERKGLIVPIQRDTCALILNRLKDIFIDKKHPIIVSKTKTDYYVSAELPFIDITILYNGRKIKKSLYVGEQNDNYIYEFSECFAELWDIIHAIIYNFKNIQN